MGPQDSRQPCCYIGVPAPAPLAQASQMPSFGSPPGSHRSSQPGRTKALETSNFPSRAVLGKPRRGLKGWRSQAAELGGASSLGKNTVLAAAKLLYVEANASPTVQAGVRGPGYTGGQAGGSRPGASSHTRLFLAAQKRTCVAKGLELQTVTRMRHSPQNRQGWGTAARPSGWERLAHVCLCVCVSVEAASWEVWLPGPPSVPRFSRL